MADDVFGKYGLDNPTAPAINADVFAKYGIEKPAPRGALAAIGSRASDAAVSLGQGVIGAGQTLYGIADLATGGKLDRATAPVMRAVDQGVARVRDFTSGQDIANTSPAIPEPLSKRLNDTTDSLNQYKSPELQAATEVVQEAGKGERTPITDVASGVKRVGEEAVAGGKTIAAMVQNPSTIVDQTLQSLPVMAGMVGTVRAGAMRAARLAAAEAEAAGGNAAAQAEAATAAATRWSTGAPGIGVQAATDFATSGAQQSQQAKTDILDMSHEDLLKSPQYRELLQTMNPADAKTALADAALRKAFVVAGTLSAMASPIGSGVEGKAARAGLVRNEVRQSMGLPLLKSAGKEFTQEALQTAGEQIGTNVGEQLAKPDLSVLDQVGPQAAMGGLVGAAMGGGMHVAGNLPGGSQQAPTTPGVTSDGTPAASATPGSVIETPPPDVTAPGAPPLPPVVPPLSPASPPNAGAEAPIPAPGTEAPAAGVAPVVAPTVRPPGPAERAAAIATGTGIAQAAQDQQAQMQGAAQAEDQQKAIAEQQKVAETAQKEADTSLDGRLSAFKAEAGAMAEEAAAAVKPAKEGEKPAEPKATPLQTALEVAAAEHFNPIAAAAAIKTATSEKRPELAAAIVERADQIAREAANAKPAMPPGNMQYDDVARTLLQKAVTARKTAERLAALAGVGQQQNVVSDAAKRAPNAVSDTATATTEQIRKGREALQNTQEPQSLSTSPQSQSEAGQAPVQDRATASGPTSTDNARSPAPATPSVPASQSAQTGLAQSSQPPVSPSIDAPTPTAPTTQETQHGQASSTTKQEVPASTSGAQSTANAASGANANTTAAVNAARTSDAATTGANTTAKAPTLTKAGWDFTATFPSPNDEEMHRAGRSGILDGAKNPEHGAQIVQGTHDETKHELLAMLGSRAAIAEGLRTGTDPATAKPFRGSNIDAHKKALRAEAMQISHGIADTFGAYESTFGPEATKAFRKHVADVFQGKTPATLTTTTPPTGALNVDNATDAGAHEAASSPTNDKTASKDQILGGNAELGHIKIGPLDISIENPEGSTRTDLAHTPPQWSRKIERAHYGYIKGTVGKDKDHIDVFVKPGTPENHPGPVYVIDQHDAKGGFDEHKAMIGYPSQLEAVGAYKANYPKSFKVGPVTQTSLAEFNTWARSGDTKQPFAAHTPAEQAPSRTVKDVGRDAFSDGKVRVPPTALTMQDKKQWLAGWDAANVAAPVPPLVAKTAETIAKPKPVREQREPGQANNSHLKRLFRVHGVDITERSDITGESGKGAHKTGAMPGTFRNGGMALDDWGEKLVADGWLHPESKNQRGNEHVRASSDDVRAFIRRVLDGEPVYRIDQAQEHNALEHSAWIEREAALTDGELTPLEVADLIDSGLSREENEQMFDAAKELVDAGYSLSEIESILERVALQSNDQSSYEQAVRAAATDRRDEKNRSGAAGEAAGENRPAIALTGETNAEVVAREKAQSDAGAAATARERESEQKAQADRDRDSFALTGSERVADTAATHGQQDLLGAAVAPAEANVIAQANAVTPAPSLVKLEAGEQTDIADFGEKIGGARKDVSVPLGKRTTISKSVDDRPAWARKYVAMEQTDRSMRPYSFPMRGDAQTAPIKTGKWQLMVTDRGDSGSVSHVMRNKTFATEAEALAAIPLAEVSRKHRVYSYKDGDTLKYAIYRQIGERNRAPVKRGFATEDEAMRYLAQHPVEIIEHKFAFPERPWLDRIERIGPTMRDGNVSTKQFETEFGFRAGEFGNWNMGGDGQAALNHAYDALHDLAQTIGIPPKAISLNGELAIAFGARGHGGEGAAAAHYEPQKVVINLTKIKGAGSLAHEWFHALDDYLTRSTDSGDSARMRKLVHGSGALPYATYGFGHKSTARAELVEAFTRLVDTMTAKKEGVAIEEEGAKRRLLRQQEDIAHALKNLRASLTNGEYNRGKRTASEAQLKTWDALAAKLSNGDGGDLVRVPAPKSAGRFNLGHDSFVDIRAMNDIHKAITGRSFDTSNAESTGRRLYWGVKSIKDANARVAAAQIGTVEERKTGTNYLFESKKIDGFRASEYWSTRHEMGARAFESYIFDKLIGAERRSDYLAHSVENKYYAALQMKPYPEGEERKAIDSAFDNLFATIQTKETDKGVALLSVGTQAEPAAAARSATVDRHSTVAAVDAWVRPALRKMANAPRLLVVQATSDSPFTNAPTTTHGLFHEATNTVWLFADNLPTREDALRTFAHETVGHGGLAGLFGNKLTPLMQRVYASNPEIKRLADLKIAAVKKQHGLNYSTALAAEEVIADFAGAGRGTEVKQWRMLLAAIRNALRELGWNITWSDGDIEALLANARKQVTERREANANAVASVAGQTARAKLSVQTPEEQSAELERVPDRAHTLIFASAKNMLSDFTTSERFINRLGKKWHTPFHFAETQPAFKPVYDSAQSYLRDIARFTRIAQDQALSLLPRVESFQQAIGRGPNNTLAADPDVKAAHDALMAGTLYGGGNPMEGIRWTDEELRTARVKVRDDKGRFTGLTAPAKFAPLNDTQIRLFRQAHNLIDTSLSETAKSVVWRAVSIKGAQMDKDHVRSLSLDQTGALAKDAADQRIEAINVQLQEALARNTDKAAETRGEQALKDLATAAAALRARADAQIADWQALKDEVDAIVDKITRLTDHGYFPAMRFGDHVVSVERVDAEGKKKQLSFQRFDTEHAANAAKRELAQQHAGATLLTGEQRTRQALPKEGVYITSGMLNPEVHKLFKGLNLDALEVLAEHIRDDNNQPISKDPLMQQYFRLAAAERSTLKRNIHRQGTPGWSTDMPRVLASFAASNAAATSRTYHGAELLHNVMAIKNGDLQSYATKYHQYMLDPSEESPGIRSLLANFYILGSLAFGAINLTQPVMTTAPWLSGHTSYKNAIKELAAAALDYARGLKGLNAWERKLYQRGIEEGVITPQEIHQLRADTQASVLGDSRTYANIKAAAGKAGVALPNKLAVRRAFFLWSSIYALTEQFNRGTTFLAAIRIAKANGHTDPFAFALDAIANSQFTYNRGNRPELSRGPVGAPLMTFKSFNISLFELFQRMVTAHDKRPAAAMALTLFALAGAQGLPFADDIEDLIDTIGQWLGFSTNTQKSVRQWAENLVGSSVANVLLHGVSGIPGMPIDVSQRMGMQNLIPGSALFKTSEPDATRDIVEMLGPAASLANAIKQTTEGVATGNYGAARALLPLALQNAAKGGEMLSSGKYVDTKERKVADVTPVESIFKMVGLQPNVVAQAQRIYGQNMQDQAQHKAVEDSIVQRLATAIVDQNADLRASAMKDWQGWNSKNPEQPIRITPAQIQTRAKSMAMNKEQRAIKSTPVELRAGVAASYRPQ